MSATTITTSDGVSLEAIVERPDSPLGTLVLCHPHPLHGGTNVVAKISV